MINIKPNTEYLYGVRKVRVLNKIKSGRLIFWGLQGEAPFEEGSKFHKKLKVEVSDEKEG